MQDQNSNNEVERLKKKCNAQIDHIQTLRKQLEEKEIELQNLKSKPYQEHFIPVNSTNSFMLAAALFGQTFRMVLTSNAFLQDQKFRQQNRPYESTEYGLVMGILEQLTPGNDAQSDAQKIARIWADLGLLLRDSRGRITHKFIADGQSLRTVRISRTTLQLIEEELP